MGSQRTQRAPCTSAIWIFAPFRVFALQPSLSRLKGTPPRRRSRRDAVSWDEGLAQGNRGDFTGSALQTRGKKNLIRIPKRDKVSGGQKMLAVSTKQDQNTHRLINKAGVFPYRMEL